MVIVILAPTSTYHARSKSGENSVALSYYSYCRGGMGAVNEIAGVQPNISAYKSKVIMAVFTNIATNKKTVIPKVSFVKVVYLENLPRALKRILSRKFTKITITAVAKAIRVKETYSTYISQQ